MTSAPVNEKAIFNAARELEAPEARRDYLEQACGEDHRLRARVEALLRAFDESSSFLQSPAEEFAGFAPATILEGPGTVIGPYRLLEPIGEGGFGVVYLAEQQYPVRRQVALKVVKPGMDTRQVIGRFEAERQALALMEHPNIAHVLDGGETPSGRPYFVMELVHGVPITEYCDQSHLPIATRLELFVDTCQAVQHAHHKGIIHRDIKPSNVLVTLGDGAPVVKVIDFGIAKATDQRLSDKLVSTQLSQVLGTPLYMSPEQAGLGHDIDTRTDIYALGVLLYELLTGSTPFDGQELEAKGIDELRRVIREEEPPKPSTRINTLGDTAQTATMNRQCDAKRLSRLLRGELDWIAMKCLEKDRTRRYQTANGLARDIERYLDDEPVEAGPPSPTYRLRKFFRRNRGPVLAAAIILLALLGGIIGTTLGLIHAEKQRLLAEAAAKAERLAKTDAEQAADAERLAKESAQKRLTQIEKGNEILAAIFSDVDPRHEKKEGKSLRELLEERLQKAANQLDEEAVGDPVAVARLQRMLGKSLYGLGYPSKAVPLFVKARATFTNHLGPDHLDTLQTMDNLALAYTAVRKNDLALPLHVEAMRRAKAKYGPETQATLSIMHNAASGYRSANKLDMAISLTEETLKLRKQTLGVHDPHTQQTMNNLGLLYVETKQLNLAIPLLEETVRLRKEHSGPKHVDYLASLNNLAMAYRAAGKLDLALPRFEEVVEVVTAKLRPDHPNTLTAVNNLAYCYRVMEKLDLALPLAQKAALGVEKRRFEMENADKIMKTVIDCHEAVKQFAEANAWRRKWLQAVKDKSGERSIAYATELTIYGFDHLQRKNWSEAEKAFREALPIRQEKAPDSWKTFSTQGLLGEALLGQGKLEAAEPLLIECYHGMKTREAQIPPQDPQVFLAGTLKVLVQLYDAWGKPAEAAKWRKKLEESKSQK